MPATPLIVLSLQDAPEAVAVSTPGGRAGGGSRSQEGPARGRHPLALQGRRQQRLRAMAPPGQGGAGLQPRGASGHRAQVPQE